MREEVAAQQGGVVSRALPEEQPDAAHVVVAEERRRRVGDTVPELEVVVVGQHRHDALRAPLTRRVADELVLEREVEQARQAAVADEGVERERVGVEDLPEDGEIADPGPTRRGADPGEPLPEERGVDVARRVDPDPVDLVALDPGRVDGRRGRGRRRAAR